MNGLLLGLEVLRTSTAFAYWLESTELKSRLWHEDNVRLVIFLQNGRFTGFLEQFIGLSLSQNKQTFSKSDLGILYSTITQL